MWDDGAIWRGAEHGELVLRSCANCARLCHPPLPMCPNCQSTDWTERAATGRATLESWLVSIRPDGSDTPRILIVARLEEGVAFVSNLIDADVDSLRGSMPLQLAITQTEEGALPFFRPAGGAA